MPKIPIPPEGAEVTYHLRMFQTDLSIELDPELFANIVATCEATPQLYELYIQVDNGNPMKQKIGIIDILFKAPPHTGSLN